jgi:HSP20 family protein
MAETTKLPFKKVTSPTVVIPAPWNPFESLRGEIDQTFENVGLGSWPGALTWPMFQTDFFRDKAWDIAPAVDVAEKEKEFEITAELPGLDEKNVEVKLTNGTLTIKGEKKEEEKEVREKGYYLSERRYGSFVRSFRVPEGVIADKIEANFAKGLLTIALPKIAEAQAEKKVPVKAA